MHLPPRGCALRALSSGQVSPDGGMKAGTGTRLEWVGTGKLGRWSGHPARIGFGVGGLPGQCWEKLDQTGQGELDQTGTPETPLFQPQVRLWPAMLLHGRGHPAPDRRLHQWQHPRSRSRLGGTPVPYTTARARPLALALRCHQLLLLLPLGARVPTLHAKAPIQRLPFLSPPSHRWASSGTGRGLGTEPRAHLTLGPPQPPLSGTPTSSPSTVPTSPSTGTGSMCWWRHS